MALISRRQTWVREEARERSAVWVIVLLGIILLVLLLALFGTGIFRGNDNRAPASSGPGPAGTNTSLPSGTQNPTKTNP